MGWFFKDKKGYPTYSKNGKRVHRVVAERKIGRKLKSWEVVHHQDEDKSNFKKNNLSVMSRSYHGKLHKAMRRGFWN